MALADDINIRKEYKAGRITLTRPLAMNAMTYDMCMAIEQALLTWRTDDDVSLIVVDAEGSRAFCAGGDILQLYETGTAGDFEFGRKFMAEEYRFNALLSGYDKPYIAFMDGIVMGGGVGISAHGSHRIVTENTKFAMPECAIGLVPDVGASSILAASPGYVGEFVGLTGARLGPEDTIYAGFADVFIPSIKRQALIDRLVKTGDEAVINTFVEKPEPGYLSERRLMIDQFFGKKNALDIARALEQEDDEWAQVQAKLIRNACALSVACSNEIIKKVRFENTIKNALKQEYRFTHRAASDGELIEGIRAQLIDKDRKPDWSMPRLEDVPREKISAMLAPLGSRELDLKY